MQLDEPTRRWLKELPSFWILIRTTTKHGSRPWNPRSPAASFGLEHGRGNLSYSKAAFNYMGNQSVCNLKNTHKRNMYYKVRLLITFNDCNKVVCHELMTWDFIPVSLILRLIGSSGECPLSEISSNSWFVSRMRMQIHNSRLYQTKTTIFGRADAGVDIQQHFSMFQSDSPCLRIKILKEYLLTAHLTPSVNEQALNWYSPDEVDKPVESWDCASQNLSICCCTLYSRNPEPMCIPPHHINYLLLLLVEENALLRVGLDYPDNG